MIQEKIRELVNYGLLTGLVEPEDEVYTTNRLLVVYFWHKAKAIGVQLMKQALLAVK